MVVLTDNQEDNTVNKEMIKLEGLKYRFRNKDKLKEFEIEVDDLTILEGDFVYLIGENGAGKSTLVKLINREIKSDDGSVYYKGKLINNFNKKEVSMLRRELGYVFQDFLLIDDMTVYENISYPLKVVGGYSESDINKRVLDVSSRLGVELKLKHYPTELSGGEKQKVSIARAMILEPDLIIADEPTGNLDPEYSEDIYEEFKKLNDEGKTILMITHNKELVDNHPHRVVKMHRGKVVSDALEGGYS